MTVLISGASRGIGKAVAAIFAANGHDLFLSSRSEVALYKAMEELQTKYSSILIKAKADNRISSVAIPGLCTGVGRMQPIIAARQMFQAYKEIILGQRMDFASFGEAQKYHWEINPQGMIWTH